MKTERKARRNARFVGDIREVSIPLDRNERTRIWIAAKALENSTRPAGFQNGVLGGIALEVLRCFLFDFMHKETGACFPSVRAIQARMPKRRGRRSIFKAFDALEAAGILTRIQRAKRVLVKVYGMMCQRVVQQSNAYRFSAPNATAHLIVVRSKAEVKDRLAALVRRMGKNLVFPQQRSGCTVRTEEPRDLLFLLNATG